MKINAINSAIQNNSFTNNMAFTGLFRKKYTYDYDVYMPEKQSKMKNKLLERFNDIFVVEISTNSITQSNYFKRNGIINYKNKISDGFIDVSSDGKIYDDGTCRSSRPIILVDRKYDSTLRQIIEKTKNETTGLDENDKVRYLTELLTNTVSKCPKANAKPNEIVKIGDTIGAFGYGGRQDSIMFKILSDEIGLKTDLVKGLAAGKKRTWNVVHYKNGVNKVHDISMGIVEDARKSKVYKPINRH